MSELWDMIQEFCNKFVRVAFSVTKKTIGTAVVFGYIILFGWSIITTLTGWYFRGLKESMNGFITLCLCIGILLHLGEKRSDNIGGNSNKGNDTELREDT